MKRVNYKPNKVIHLRRENMNLIEFTKEALTEQTTSGKERYQRIRDYTALLPEFKNKKLTPKMQEEVTIILLEWIEQHNEVTLSSKAYQEILQYYDVLKEVDNRLKEAATSSINITSSRKEILNHLHDTLLNIHYTNYSELINKSEILELKYISKYICRMDNLKLMLHYNMELFKQNDSFLRNYIPPLLEREISEQTKFMSVYTKRLKALGSNATLLFAILYDLPAGGERKQIFADTMKSIVEAFPQK